MVLDAAFFTPVCVGSLTALVDWVVAHEQHSDILVGVLLDDESHLLAAVSIELTLGFNDDPVRQSEIRSVCTRGRWN